MNTNDRCRLKQSFFAPFEWSAAKDFAMLMLLTGGNRYAAQELWLRKVRILRLGLNLSRRHS